MTDGTRDAIIALGTGPVGGEHTYGGDSRKGDAVIRRLCHNWPCCARIIRDDVHYAVDGGLSPGESVATEIAALVKDYGS